MKSLDRGVTKPQTVRMPGHLTERIMRWGAPQGVTVAAAIRELVEIGLQHSADHPDTPRVRPALQWIARQSGSRKQRHACAAVVLPPKTGGDYYTGTEEHELRMRTKCEGYPCTEAWKTNRDLWVIVRLDAPSHADQEALWGVLRVTPQALRITANHGYTDTWFAIPRKELPDLIKRISDVPGPAGRVIAHATY